MSTTDSIVDSLSSSSSTTSTSSAGLAGITGTDFMNILVKQLQMQDPMKPMTNEEMVSQLSTIRELEMNTRMSDKLEQLTDQQRFGSAAALIGRQVQGTVEDEDGNEYTSQGVVSSVYFTSKGDCILSLDNGQLLPLTALEAVTNATDTNADQTDGSTTDDSDSTEDSSDSSAS